MARVHNDKRHSHPFYRARNPRSTLRFHVADPRVHNSKTRSNFTKRIPSLRIAERMERRRISVRSVRHGSSIVERNIDESEGHMVTRRVGEISKGRIETREKRPLRRRCRSATDECRLLN